MAQLSILFGLLSLLVKSPEHVLNNELLVFSILFAGIFSFGVAIGISKNTELGSNQKLFWLILAVALPFLGAIIYQLMHQPDKTIVAEAS